MNEICEVCKTRLAKGYMELHRNDVTRWAWMCASCIMLAADVGIVLATDTGIFYPFPNGHVSETPEL